MREQISNGHVTLTADDMGAEPVSVVFCGTERLWQNENGAWGGHAPVLFPVCGHCGMLLNGKTYPLSAHGFAKKSVFTLVSRGDDFLRYRLLDSPRTRELYPFSFAFDVCYRLMKKGFSILYTVTNTGAEELPFSCGGHVSFAVKNIADCFVDLGQDEPLVRFLHDDGGYLTGERVNESNPRSLPLAALTGGETWIYPAAKAKPATILSKAGAPLARLNFQGFQNLLLWRPNGADMVCLEPWNNLPDRVGEDKEFREKEGVLTLSIGQHAEFLQQIEYF